MSAGFVNYYYPIIISLQDRFPRSEYKDALNTPYSADNPADDIYEVLCAEELTAELVQRLLCCLYSQYKCGIVYHMNQTLDTYHKLFSKGLLSELKPVLPRVWVNYVLSETTITEREIYAPLDIDLDKTIILLDDLRNKYLTLSDILRSEESYKFVLCLSRLCELTGIVLDLERCKNELPVDWMTTYRDKVHCVSNDFLASLSITVSDAVDVILRQVHLNLNIKYKSSDIDTFAKNHSFNELSGCMYLYMLYHEFLRNNPTILTKVRPDNLKSFLDHYAPYFPTLLQVKHADEVILGLHVRSSYRDYLDTFYKYESELLSMLYAYFLETGKVIDMNNIAADFLAAIGYINNDIFHQKVLPLFYYTYFDKAGYANLCNRRAMAYLPLIIFSPDDYAVFTLVNYYNKGYSKLSQIPYKGLKDYIMATVNLINCKNKIMPKQWNQYLCGSDLSFIQPTEYVVHPSLVFIGGYSDEFIKGAPFCPANPEYVTELDNEYDYRYKCNHLGYQYQNIIRG